MQHRSMLLLLISALVLSVAFAVPASLEASLEEQDSQLALKAESVENVDSIEEAKNSVSSSEEPKDEVNEKVDSSSVSSEEEKVPEKPAARTRRSAEEEKYRNLYHLATICPKKDFTTLEENPLLSVRIEIKDMYAICAQLKDRQPAQRRR